jgi:hypothetical protein
VPTGRKLSIPDSFDQISTLSCRARCTVPGAHYSREELRKQLVAALPSVPMKIVFGVFYWLVADLFAHAPILKMSGSLPGEFAFTEQSMMPGPSPSTVSSSMGRH